MRSSSSVCLAVLALAASAARADHKVVVREETASFELQGSTGVDLDVPVGELRVLAGDGPITAHVWLRCEEGSTRCRTRAAELHLVPVRGADRLAIKVEGYEGRSSHGIHHPEVELELHVPVALAVKAHVGVGEASVTGIEGDVDLDVGVGDAKVEAPESAVHSASIDVGLGEATLTPRPSDSEHKGFLHLGNKVSWHEGPGHSHITVEVGVGDGVVHVEPAAAPAS